MMASVVKFAAPMGYHSVYASGQSDGAPAMTGEGLQSVRRAIIERADITHHALRAGFRRKGRGWLCAFHPDRRPSASIHRGRVYCFTCGTHWNVVDLEMRTRGCDFITALRSLAEEYHIPWPHQQLSRAEQDDLAAKRERDIADLESAKYWRVALVHRIEAWLNDLKVDLMTAFEHGGGAVEVPGERIRALTHLEAVLKHASRAELLRAFRSSRAHSPELVSGLIAEALSGDQGAREVAVGIISLLEAPPLSHGSFA